MCLDKYGGVIRCDSLSKSFGGRPVVRALSFTAPAGAVTGFLGPNGAGKTTTFRMLLGLTAPDAGTSTIGGKSYGDLHDPRGVVGAALESTGFHPSRSGRDHLRVVASAAGIPTRRCDEVLDLVGLRSAAMQRAGGYSTGMRQRLALATALLGDPAVLILDEPTNGLDPAGVIWIRSLMRSWADEGRCVVVSSHVLAEVAVTADRVVIVADGSVVHEGPATAVTATELERLFLRLTAGPDSARGQS